LTKKQIDQLDGELKNDQYRAGRENRAAGLPATNSRTENYSAQKSVEETKAMMSMFVTHRLKSRPLVLAFTG